MIDRRTFLAGTGAVFLAAPLAAEAQQPGKVARLGFLSVADRPPLEEASKSPILSPLKDLGWIAGQNIAFEARYAGGQSDRLPLLAVELVRLKVDLIVTLSNQETLAAKQATTSIPIVMLLATLPVEAGLVASLSHPGGNVTGTTAAPAAFGKYLELLKEAVPKLKRVTAVKDPTFFGPHVTDEQYQADARTLGLTLTVIETRQIDDLSALFSKLARERPGGLVVLLGGPLLARIHDIVDFSRQHRLPTIFPGRNPVDGGGLMSYGYNRTTLLRLAASYIDRILRGARPADLPVEQPTKFELVINLKTAKALGLTIPPSLLARADQVIE